MLYDLPCVRIESPVELPSFGEFPGRGQRSCRTLGLRFAAALPLEETPIYTARHKEMTIDILPDGWQFSLPRHPECAVRLLQDRATILSTPMSQSWQWTLTLPLLRTAIECAAATDGMMSLHCACVGLEGQAVCFTAPSGTGKSTRAMQWVDALGAELLSGDRPILFRREGNVFASGAPWDGKEQVYRNRALPVKAICRIVRSDRVSLRRLNPGAARELLLQQSFLPMWDTEAAAAILGEIRRMQELVPILELHCGPDAAAARESRERIFGNLLEEIAL